MRSLSVVWIGSATILLSATFSLAQPPEGRGERGPGGGRGERGNRGGPPPSRILQALDTDGDLVLSADEIAAAVTALKKLDRNDDGKLSREELRPTFGGRGGPGFGRGGPPGEGQVGIVERLLEFDENNDGKVSEDEIPERMRNVFDRADRNRDGAIDQDELAAVARRFQQQRGPESQGGPEGRDRAGIGRDGSDGSGPGGRRDRDSARPQRPRRPDPE